jgi:hypothetical protein
MLGLFIGAAHLFLMLNAGVRSVAGKWWLGGVAAIARIVLLMALSMAGTRIRSSGAEATSSLTIALYAGPALTVLACALSFLRKRRAEAKAGSEEEARVAKLVMQAWIAVAAMDVIYIVVNAVRLTRAQG